MKVCDITKVASIDRENYISYIKDHEVAKKHAKVAVTYRQRQKSLVRKEIAREAYISSV